MALKDGVRLVYRDIAQLEFLLVVALKSYVNKIELEIVFKTKRYFV